MKKQISLLLTVCVAAASVVFPARAERREGAIDLSDKTQTGGSSWNDQNPYGNAFDGDTDTFFDGSKGSWCQVDLGGVYNITKISCYPRDGRLSNKGVSEYVARMNNSTLYGSLDGETWTELYTYSGLTTDKTDESAVTWYDAALPAECAYRHIKWGNDGSIEANIAEIEIYGDVSGETGETETPEPTPTARADADGFSLLDRAGWTVETNSQQSSSGGNSAAMVLDGDSSTIWHSSWTNAANYDPDDNPVYLTVNMGSRRSVSGIRYTPRTKNSSAGSINGVITAYEVYASDDNAAWTKIGEGNMGYTKDDETNAVKDIIFAPTECQYVKLVVKDNLDNGGAYVGSCAEFDMYTYSGDPAEHPIAAERARLDEFSANLDALAGGDIKIKLLEKAENLKTCGTVDGIETFLSTAEMLSDALGWIEQGMDDVYIQRIMDMLTQSDMSAESLEIANAELSPFYATGSEAKEKWETNCGDEYTISGEELDLPLYTRVINAAARAKARIGSDGRDYKMLKELVSYITSRHDYAGEGYGNDFGMSADNCEIIVSNINFALSNLEKIDAGTLKTELTTYNSGEMWLDTLGSKISAHGGQIIKRGDMYYWYGEDNKISYPLTTGVSCYSSSDLKNWTYEGIAFRAFDDGTEERRFTKEFLTDNILGTQGRIERPKVIYNAKNDNYVMWMHLEKDGGYGLSVMGVAVSDSPTGPFVWKWYGRPVCDEYVTNGSYHPFFRDMNLFVDDDGRAYVFVSSENNQVMYEVRLNEDYTWIDADDLESSGSTMEDIVPGKVIIPDMTVSGGTGSYIGASYTYGLKSFTRYQLASGGAAALTKKKDESGNDAKDADGNQIYVSTRADGLLSIPEYSDGRWARVGQNIGEGNGAEGKTETIVNNDTTLQREAPAPIKIGGRYYLVTSGLSGWYANASLTQTADNILGPWTYTGNPMTGAGPENDGRWDKDANTGSSFNSQSTCVTELPDGTYMYMGDRWKDGRYELPGHVGVKRSTYVWLPITFENDSSYGENTLKVRWHDSWSMGSVPTPAPEKPSKPSGEVRFDGTVTEPEYIADAGDTYDIMREYTVDGKYAPYYDDIWYYDRITVDLKAGAKYNIKIKEYAESGTSTQRGLYFILKDGSGARIDNTNYLQDKVMTAGDGAETVLSNISGDEHSSVIIEMKIICFDKDSRLRVGITAERRGCEVTAGDGVELINIPEDGCVIPGSRVRYTCGGKTYLTGPVTESTRITSAEQGEETTDEYSKYLFVHFTGNDKYEQGEQIYFSVSDNAVDWTHLNGRQPVLKSSMGTTGVRDPHIVRSPENDKFYMIATDLHIYDGGGWDAAQYKASKKIMIWESDDLVNWSEQREYALGDEIDAFNVGCVWAPESVWDAEKQQYMVFWASMVCPEKPEGYDALTDDTEKYNLMKSNSKQRIYRSYTSDFKTFTKPELYIERDNHVIDTTILYQDGVYYRYSKDETTKKVGCEYSASLDGPWTATALGISGCEGPTAFKFNNENKWGVYVDALGGGWSGYGLFATDNLHNGDVNKDAITNGDKGLVDGAYTFTNINSASIIEGTSGLRHGTIIPITDAEYDALLAAYPEESADYPGGCTNKTYYFSSDTTASGGAVNSGAVTEWKITSTPEYFYIDQADFDSLEKITIHSGHGGSSYGGTYKLYAYDSGGEALTKERLAEFKTDSSALGTEIAKVTDSNDKWGYNTITIDKSAVTQDKGDGNYTLDEANSSPLSIPEGTGTKALVLGVEYTTASPAAYFDYITLSYSADNTFPTRWESYADGFNGRKSDDAIVWKKFSNNSAGGTWELDADGVLTMRSNADAAPGDVCYGVTAVIKNIKPETKYYITFKEKSELAEVTNPAHGLYLKPDTMSTTAAQTDASKITNAAETRNNNNISLHGAACADADWEERTIIWTSGTGIKTEGDDTYAAKLEFTLRSASGYVRIKDLIIFEEPEESALAPVSISGEGIKRCSVVIDKTFKKITIPVYPGTDISKLGPVIENAEGVSAELTSGSWENGTVTFKKDGYTEDWSVTAVERANPIFDGYYADPNIVIFGDTYYIYPTTDGGTDWNSTSFKCFSSKDLVNWTDEGVILELKDVPWSSGVYGWAPTVAEKDGKYYFYFSSAGKTSSAKQLGVAVADSPTGPFTAADEPIISSDNGYTSGGQMIDPHVFTDDNGTAYIYWGNGSMYGARLNADMTSVDWSSFVKIDMSGKNYKEGTFVIKRNGKYYFMWSDGDTGNWDYNVRYGVSDTPLPSSFDGNTRILSRNNTDDEAIRGTAHHSVVNIPGTDDWYICYHRFNIPLYGDVRGQSTEAGNHREVCIDRLTFAEDGSINEVTATLKGITEPVTIPKTQPSEKPSDEPEKVITDIVIEGGVLKSLKLELPDGAAMPVLYIAEYDGDGVLRSLRPFDAVSGETELNAPIGDNARLMLWNGNQAPLTEALTLDASASPPPAVP